MKVKNLKTRIAAFGLAVLMGVSTLSSANAFAAEQTDVGQEVQASEQAVTSQKEQAVTADDITKEISDETFAVETSMEGIHYDAEKEDVTLISIQDEKGGEYHPDKAGTYIASYMVVPKDQSDSYTISRKVILTDTEGQAHAQDNGGEKQKSDTKSEDDSDSPVQNYTDVEIEASGEDASAQAVKELKEDIEEGNVMVLSAAERATSSGSTVTLTKGRTIYYPSYIGNYLTCLFTVNGKIAYCLQSQKASPPTGSYVAQVLDSNKNLQKVLYYGYGGAGDLTGSYLAVENALVDQVIESMEGEIPQAMYETRMDEMVNDFAFRVEQQGLRLEDYLKYMGQTMEQFRASFMPQAEKQVKIRLALEAVAAAENIEASEEDVSAEIKRIADQYKMEEDKVRELVNVDDLKKDLAINKAIDFIKSHANIVEKAAEAEKTEDAE